MKKEQFKDLIRPIVYKYGSGWLLDEPEMLEEICKKYHNKQLTIHSVSKRFDDQKFIDNVIVSYRHDFGLLDKQEQDNLRFECKEWMRAIKNNEPY